MRCVCPKCYSTISVDEAQAQCSGCGQVYPTFDSIILFAQSDDFYEGKFTETWGEGNRLWWRIKAQMVSRWRYTLRWLPPGNSTILDIGCGGGNTLLTKNDNYVVGIDLSKRSLKNAGQVYDEVYGADVSRLPFEDDTFDCVLSLDVLGHIPADQKDRAIAEMYRVVRPGGRTLHHIETVGQNRLQTFAQRYPELYQQHFIDLDGHYGLERPSKAIARFRAVGFIPLEEVGIEVGVVRSLREHLKRFNNEYRAKSQWVSWTVCLYDSLGRNALTRYLIEGGLAIVMWLAQSVMPLDSADSIFVCYRKP